MARTIEARVIQKVATEAEWLNVALPLYNGEIALVRSGDRVVNMKVGNGTSKFSELNYIYNGGFNGSINPSTVTTELQNGFYFAEVSGTYNNAGGIVVKEGYYTVLEKYSGGWKKSTEVKMPMQDLTDLENRTTALENRIEPNGNVTVGQTNRAVNGDKVERYVQRNAFVDFKHSFADKDGYEVNSKVFVDNKFWISKVDGNKDYPSKSSTKWEEFKITEDLENSVNTLDGKIQVVEDNINTLEGIVQVVEDNINTLESELDITKGKVTALENKNGGEVEFGNTKNVEGRKVFDYVNNKSITKFDPTAYEGGYPIDALVFHNDNVWKSMVNLNTETPQKGTSKWKEVKMSADVDQEFDENSENAISNKKVSIIKNALDYFIGEANSDILPLNFVQGIIDNNGVLNSSTTSTKIFTIDVGSDWKHLKIVAKHWQSTSQSAVDQYSTILAQKSDNTFVVLEVSKLISNSSSVPSTFELRIDNPQNYKKIFINALNSYANNEYCVVMYSDIDVFNSVKKYIDNALDTDKLSIVKQETVDTDEVEVFDISKIKPNYSMSGVTGAEASTTGANISNWIDVKKGDTIRINSDRIVVGYKTNGNSEVSNVQKIYSAINTEPIQMERVIVITDDNIKAIRFVYMSTFTNIYAKKTSQANSGNYYIDARDVRYGNKSITDYLNSSKQAVKPYIYPLRKKIINASIRENDIISAIGNNVVKYGLNEVEEVIHTITSVSDWRCVWTAKNGITYFSPMNSYSNGTDALNYGLYRYDNNSVTKVIQLTNRQSIWGIDEDNQGNLYAGVYDLGGASNPSLFKSTDGGLTWNVIKSWSTLKHIHDVMVDKRTNHLYVFLGDTYSAIQNFKSTDGGITWQDICPMDKIQMTDSVASENYRFFGTDHSPYGRIYRTSDDLTMSICLDIGYYSNIFFLRVSDLTGWIYAGFKSDPSATGSGLLCSVWVSKNEGDTWEEVKRLTAPIAGDGFWFASEFKDGNLIVGCRQGGNGHANWQGYGITENANLMYNSEGIVGTRLKAFL